MNKYILSGIALVLSSPAMWSQSAIDAYRLSQPDMKGTARYMGMAGAFGALGGDLSAISSNPGGIGVYRNSDFGFTLDLDLQSANASSEGSSYDISQTKFLLNNIGAVLALRLPSTVCPNLNFGFTYNKSVSFNRKYGGNIPRLSNSMSNYIAGIANADNIVESELATTSGYDPYNPGPNDYAAPWLAILGYDGYLITPSANDEFTRWYGQWGDGTQGSGAFLVNEKGSIDDFNIVLGGNISNVVYWGMNFDITNLNYNINSIWEENLTNAYVPDAENMTVRESADWNINNLYNVSGTGFNYQIGIIVKPIQELRLGLAFHTPTWYNLTETYGANLRYLYGGTESGSTETNNGILGYNEVSFRTPCKLIASAAGVIGSNLIVSFDYEWVPYNNMKYSPPGSYGNNWDYGYDWGGWDYLSAESSQIPMAPTKSIFDSDDPYYDTNSDIKTYYCASNTFRLGLEYKFSQGLSVRAGYANISSPVKKEAKNGSEIIYTSGTMPNYRFDNSTNYLTLGLGYRYKRWYVDLAYVYKNMKSEYHAYTPDPDARGGTMSYSPQSKISLNNNQIVLSAGFRF